MHQAKLKLSLHQPITYQIKVPGVFDENITEWNCGVRIARERDDQGVSITILTVTVDQAALHSLLRRLYSLGIPLISIQLIGEM